MMFKDTIKYVDAQNINIIYFFCFKSIKKCDGKNIWQIYTLRCVYVFMYACMCFILLEYIRIRKRKNLIF